MSDFEDRINAILSSPAEMEKLKNMASRLIGGDSQGTGVPSANSASRADAAEDGGFPDPELMKKLGSLMTSSGSDDKTALLRAMEPYMSPERRGKLEKAVRFARLAKVAGLVLGESGGGRDV